MRLFILSFLLVFVSFGCASKKIRKEVKQEVAQAPIAKNDSELYALENKILVENPNLTEEQRTNLQALIDKTKARNKALDNEINQTKTVLFESLIDKESSKAKIKYLEIQLHKLNRKKVNNSLSAYREAKTIVGKSDIPLEQTLRMIDNRTKYQF